MIKVDKNVPTFGSSKTYFRFIRKNVPGVLKNTLQTRKFSFWAPTCTIYTFIVSQQKLSSAEKIMRRDKRESPVTWTCYYLLFLNFMKIWRIFLYLSFFLPFSFHLTIFRFRIFCLSKKNECREWGGGTVQKNIFELILVFLNPCHGKRKLPRNPIIRL